jgi:hypothetical protein
LVVNRQIHRLHLNKVPLFLCHVNLAPILIGRPKAFTASKRTRRRTNGCTESAELLRPMKKRRLRARTPKPGGLLAASLGAKRPGLRNGRSSDGAHFDTAAGATPRLDPFGVPPHAKASSFNLLTCPGGPGFLVPGSRVNAELQTGAVSKCAPSNGRFSKRIALWAGICHAFSSRWLWTDFLLTDAARI